MMLSWQIHFSNNSYGYKDDKSMLIIDKSMLN